MYGNIYRRILNVDVTSEEVLREGGKKKEREGERGREKEIERIIDREADIETNKTERQRYR